jgi:hypothetical protein
MKQKYELIALQIPKNQLGKYKEYIGHLFKNENSVFNICKTEEDIVKSNQWFKNFPLKTFVVSYEPLKIGDKFFGKCNNESLNNKVFTYLGMSDGGIDLIDIMDEDGNKHISTILLLESPKFIRYTTSDDLEIVVNKQSLNIF